MSIEISSLTSKRSGGRAPPSRSAETYIIYQIPVENQKELDFIMSNKKTAVTQILKYGKLKTE